MKRIDIERYLETLWYGTSNLYRLLLPLSWLFCSAVYLRRLAYRLGVKSSTTLGCPVVIVGNIVVGGSGKTPLVIALSKYLQQAGLRVGILTRGYRRRAGQRIEFVGAGSDPDTAGDEAVLLAQKTRLPVVAGADRADAGKALLAQSPCDVILCDDGLQHYALKRDLEIAVVDPDYGLGNQACLPAGPLREPRRRLQDVDAVVALNGQYPEATFSLPFQPPEVYRLDEPAERHSLSRFAGHAVHAVAGIARSQRFFSRLAGAGIDVKTHAFGDHHRFTPECLTFNDALPVLMTEKDAVKCQPFGKPDCWAVTHDVRIDAEFGDWLLNSLRLGEH